MGAEITAKRTRRQAELARFYSATKLRNRALTTALTTSDFEASVVTAIEARSPLLFGYSSPVPVGMTISLGSHPSSKTEPPRGAALLARLAFARHGLQGPYRRIGPTAATLAAVALPTTQPK